MKQLKKPKFYTIPEAAKELGVSRQAIYKAIDKGLLGKLIDRKVVQTKVVKTTMVVKTISATAVQAYRVSEPHQSAGKKISDG